MRTLTYATSLALSVHSGQIPGVLIFDWSTPHRRFRAAVVVHAANPGRLLRQELSMTLSNRVMLMRIIQVPLAMLCSRFAAGRNGHRANQNHQPRSHDPGNDADHFSLRTNTGYKTT